MGFTRTQVFEIEQVLGKAFSKETLLKHMQQTITKAVELTIKTVMAEITQQIVNLRNEVSSLKEENKVPEKKCVMRSSQLEQYMRRNNLRILGVPETANENTERGIINLIREKLKITLSDSAIDCCYHIGKRLEFGIKHRAILINLTNYKHKNLVFTNKKLLKGSGIVIKEDLCSTRIETLREAMKRYGAKSVWTRDGNIFIRTARNNVLRVAHNEDLNNVTDDMERED